MIIAEHLEAWRGQSVIDPTGESLGKLEEVYLDAASREPILIAVKSGLLGRHSSLIPVDDATVGPDYVRVAHERSTVEQASATAADQAPDAEALESLGSVYGLRFAERLSLQSASDLDAQRAAAEEARRRADELEADARDKEARRDEAKAQAEGAGSVASQADEEAAEARRAAEEARSTADRHDNPGGGA